MVEFSKKKKKSKIPLEDSDYNLNFGETGGGGHEENFEASSRHEASMATELVPEPGHRRRGKKKKKARKPSSEEREGDE